MVPLGAGSGGLRGLAGRNRLDRIRAERALDLAVTYPDNTESNDCYLM